MDWWDVSDSSTLLFTGGSTTISTALMVFVTLQTRIWPFIDVCPESDGRITNLGNTVLSCISVFYVFLPDLIQSVFPDSDST